ncbi:hypothetical protein Bca4012_030553 [Brassica carinata]
MEVDKGKYNEDDVGEDNEDDVGEDNEEDCMTYDDKDDGRAPSKGGSGGPLGINMEQHSGSSGGRGEGFQNPASSGSDGSISNKQRRKRKILEGNVDEGNDDISTSRPVGFGYGAETDTFGGGDVVLITPPKK